MDHATWLLLWGSPVGIAIFFAGLGVLLWGLSKLKHSEVAKAEMELKERQRHQELAQQKETGGPPAQGSR